MIAKILVAGAILAGLAAPALADTRYYVAQDPSTHKCSVVTTRPDGKTMLEIGKHAATEADAQSAMAAAPECKSQ
jgi:hypothetical protein